MAKHDGYSKERYQSPQLGRAWNSITAYDLTATAANTPYGKFYCPAEWGAINIFRLGFVFSANGSTETTNGTLSIAINGTTLVDNASNVIQVASFSTHTEGESVDIWCNLNWYQTQVAAPVYPQLTYATGDVLTWLNPTQGVGGTQTVFPYILFGLASGL